MWGSPAAKQECELNNQDRDHHHLQHKRAALLKLFDHEAIQVVSGFEFLVNQLFVIENTDFRRCKPLQAGSKHIADELDGIVGALG